MLAEVLGGINCVKASVLTPYYHTIGKFLIINWNFKKKGFLKNREIVKLPYDEN